VALEEILVDRDIFVRDEPLSRFVLVNGVDEHRRMSITETVEKHGDIQRHGADRILETEI
jgi:hypothetical protein